MYFNSTISDIALIPDSMCSLTKVIVRHTHPLKATPKNHSLVDLRKRARAMGMKQTPLRWVHPVYYQEALTTPKSHP